MLVSLASLAKLGTLAGFLSFPILAKWPRLASLAILA